MQDWPVCIYPNHSNACFLEQISGGYYDVIKTTIYIKPQ